MPTVQFWWTLSDIHNRILDQHWLLWTKTGLRLRMPTEKRSCGYESVTSASNKHTADNTSHLQTQFSKQFFRLTSLKYLVEWIYFLKKKPVAFQYYKSFWWKDAKRSNLFSTRQHVNKVWGFDDTNYCTKHSSKNY